MKSSLIRSAKKILNTIFSTSAAGLYILAFAFSIGAATFIENDFGTSSAFNIVFNSWWFELILFLFGISLIVNIFRFRMIQQKKWAILTFHLSIIVILTGAAITRYTAYEGIMHIREGQSSNTFLSSNTYLQFTANNGVENYVFSEPVLFSSLGKNNFKKSYILGNHHLVIELQDFIPNPVQQITKDDSGVPVLKIVFGGVNGRDEYFLNFGDQIQIHNTLFNFGNANRDGAFNINYEDGNLLFISSVPYTQIQMATQKKDTLGPSEYHPLLLRSLYSSGMDRFVFSSFEPGGSVNMSSGSEKMSSTSVAGLKLKVSEGSLEKNLWIVGGKGMEGNPGEIQFDDLKLSVSYGAKRIVLPFSLHLNDFIMERYPGTNSASSYASEVTLLAPRDDLRRDHRIYMNHILNYEGYRFFQSSYDQDEQGTYLSVNHDLWGSRTSYLGYALLTVGMLFTFFSKNTRFYQLKQNLKKLKGITPILILFLSLDLCAQDRIEAQPRTIDSGHAQLFGRVLVQDYNGRLKPMNTFTNEILRKVSGKEEINDLNSGQVVLGMAMNPQAWYGINMIKLGRNPEIRTLIGTKAKLASYRDFFEIDGGYKLREQVRNAYNMPPRDRGSFEKELLKLDERVNICSMVFSGRFMRVFPLQGDPNHAWHAPAGSGHQPIHDSGQSSFTDQFYPQYIAALQRGADRQNWLEADGLVNELRSYQEDNGGHIIPSKSRVNSELFLNRVNVFGKLVRYYGILGLVFLVLLFISVFKPTLNLKWPFRISLTVMILTFLFHTMGLALRWYVSGRAPWSNGYESMIYIAFTTVLAGLIFSHKSSGGLAASCILSATILMVAGLSWLDPEITPLVPVLKSYWLTIHVSLEAGSYGFLMLGAIIGVINLLLMIIRTRKNHKNIQRIIVEMTWISEMSLIGGLFMISVGTYLGGVWANESWGRYWGWDAKETWALVTILVYAFILHMRFIPGLRGLLAFNVASLFGWASVIMTYFGVNYYLSGLHSYAAGDPIPIPPFVYYTVGSLLVIGIMAWIKDTGYKKLKLSDSVTHS